MDHEKEIREFFKEYQGRWNNHTYQTLGELWDHDDDKPFYRPMERDEYITDWPSLEKYFDPKPGVTFIEELRFEYKNLTIKLVAPDVAVVMSDFEWDMKVKGGDYAKPISGLDPVICVLKRKPEGWRMSAYVEACMHPTMYVQKLAAMSVRPAFRNSLVESGKMKPAKTGDITEGDQWI